MKSLLLIVTYLLSTIFAHSQTISDSEFVSPTLCNSFNEIGSYSVRPTPYIFSSVLNLTNLQHDSIGTTNKQYDIFKKQYNKSRKNASTGSVIMGVGAVAVVTGLILNGNTNQQALSQVLLITGFIVFNIGAPITVSNGVKAENNRKAMEKVENNIKVSLSASNNGIGFIVNF